MTLDIETTWHEYEPVSLPPLPATVPLGLVLNTIDTRLAFLRSCDGSYAYELDLLELRRQIVQQAREWRP